MKSPISLKNCVLSAALLAGMIFARVDSTPQGTANPAVHPPGSEATLILPKGLSPTEVFTTSSQSLVVKVASGAANYRALYSWEPGNDPKLIIGGSDVDVVRLTDDVFASWYSQNDKEFIVTMNAQQLVSQPLLLPPGTPTGWYGCEGDVRTLVCIGNRPGMSVNDKDFDEMAFSAVLTVDLEQEETSWFPVEHGTYHHFDPAKKIIYLSNLDNPTINSPIGILDLAGKPRGKAQFWDTDRSPSGRFADSVQAEGSEGWEIYDAKSKAGLLAFNCSKPGCRVGDREESHFRSPVNDGEIVALQEGGAYGKGGTCDIYQVSPPRLLKRLPCGGLPVYDWSRDGREIITIEYETGRFCRQAVH
jgi:hypothetical protein